MEAAIAALKAAGAEVVDPADLPSMIATEPARNLTSHSICELPFAGKASDDLCSIVLRYGMKRDFNLWLATLGDVGAGEVAHRAARLEPGAQGLTARSATARGGWTSPTRSISTRTRPATSGTGART